MSAILDNYERPSLKKGTVQEMSFYGREVKIDNDNLPDVYRELLDGDTRSYPTAEQIRLLLAETGEKEIFDCEAEVTSGHSTETLPGPRRQLLEVLASIDTLSQEDFQIELRHGLLRHIADHSKDWRNQGLAGTTPEEICNSINPAVWAPLTEGVLNLSDPAFWGVRPSNQPGKGAIAYGQLDHLWNSDIEERNVGKRDPRIMLQDQAIQSATGVWFIDAQGKVCHVSAKDLVDPIAATVNLLSGKGVNLNNGDGIDPSKVLMHMGLPTIGSHNLVRRTDIGWARTWALDTESGKLVQVEGSDHGIQQAAIFRVRAVPNPNDFGEIAVMRPVIYVPFSVNK